MWLNFKLKLGVRPKAARARQSIMIVPRDARSRIDLCHDTSDSCSVLMNRQVQLRSATQHWRYYCCTMRTGPLSVLRAQ
jgi:hypothetical protein